MTAAVATEAAASGESQAELQSQYAEADRAITPEEFVIPDLNTPAARKAARKAGIDIKEFLKTG